MEEFCPDIENKDKIKLDQKKSFFILSARTQKSLNLALENWKSNINNGNLDTYKLEDISNVLMKSREQFSYRFGTIATDIHDVSKVINEFTSKPDSIEMKPFLGVIGNNQYNGWSNLSDELTEIPCFIEELEILHSEVLSAGISEEEWKEFQSNQWSNSKNRLYSFLLDVLLIRTYMNLGMKLDTLSGYGMGSSVALVISNIVSIEDMIAYLQGTKKLEDITFKRPEIDFYDWRNQTTLKRYHIEKTYIDDLFRQISLPSEQCNEYFKKAKILYYNQYTFKKFMKEWDPYVSQWGDVEHMIEEIELSSEEINASDTKRLALLIMIMSSLNRVNRKWNLTEDRVFTCSAIYELLNLITDSVIGKNDFIQLIQKKF